MADSTKYFIIINDEHKEIDKLQENTVILEIYDITHIDGELLKELKKLLKSYDFLYRGITTKNKSLFYDVENKLRTGIEEKEYDIEGSVNVGYLLDTKKEFTLDKNLLIVMKERKKGLIKCLANVGYLDLDLKEYFSKELKTLTAIEKKRISDKEKIIDMCENVEWDYPKNTTQCDIVIEQLTESKKLHSKTIPLNDDITTRHLVLGSKTTERYSIFNFCNTLFIGKAYGIEGVKQCDKLVGWNILLNKYYVLSAYYKNSLFIRFLLSSRNVTPHRRTFIENKMSSEKVGSLRVGPFILNIFNEPDKTLHFSNIEHNYTLTDETNKYTIMPTLLRPNLTITYTEFRDLLIYLNLPVFRSKLHKYMLFFPNHVQHKNLLKIQGRLVNNHTLPYPKSIQWRWFNLLDVDAQREIKQYCSYFDEDINDPDYGIEPVNYVWYSVKLTNTFGEEHFKNYIFLKTKDIRDVKYFSKSSVLFSINTVTGEITYYIYNDIIHDHALMRLNKQHNINVVYLLEGQESTIVYYRQELSRLRTKLMEEEKKAKIHKEIHKGFDEWVKQRERSNPKKSTFEGGWMKKKHDYNELKQYKTN